MTIMKNIAEDLSSQNLYGKNMHLFITEDYYQNTTWLF